MNTAPSVSDSQLKDFLTVMRCDPLISLCQQAARNPNCFRSLLGYKRVAELAKTITEARPGPNR